MAATILTAIDDLRAHLEPAKKDKGPAPAASVGDCADKLLQAISSACDEDYKKLEEVKTSLTEAKSAVASAYKKSFGRKEKPDPTEFNERKAVLSRALSALELVTLQAAASDVYGKVKLVRRVVADAKKDLLDQDFDDYSGSVKTLSKRSNTLKDAVAVVLAAVPSKKKKAAEKVVAAFSAAVDDVISESANAAKKPKASREKLAAVDTAVGEVEETVRALVKPKEAWELVLELDVLVHTDPKVTEKNKKTVIAEHAKAIETKLAETEAAVKETVKKAEQAREAAGGASSDNGHVLDCALADVNAVSKSHFSAITAFANRVKSRGVFEKNIRLKIGRRSQQVQQALRRLEPMSPRQLKKQNLVSNLKELERLTEALSSVDVTPADREEILNQINYLLLLVDTQARVNAHHDKEDPKNQQRVHLILGNLERAIRKLDALSKSKSKEQAVIKKERVHRKLARLARCAKAVSNAAQEFLKESEESRNAAAAAFKSGDKESAKEAAKAVMDDVHKLSVLATDAHSSDVAVNTAAKKAQKAADGLSSAEEKIEDGDKSVLDDVKNAVDAAASLNSVVQAAERRLADAEAKNGAADDDDDDEERETDSHVSVPPEPAAALAPAEESVSMSESEKQNDLSAAAALSGGLDDLVKLLQSSNPTAADINNALAAMESNAEKAQQAIIDQDPNAANRAFLSAVASAATISEAASKVGDYMNNNQLDKAARTAEVIEKEQTVLNEKISQCAALEHGSDADAALKDLASTAQNLEQSTKSMVDAVNVAAENPSDQKKVRAAIKATLVVRKVSDDVVETAIDAKVKTSPDAEHDENITKSTIAAAKSRAGVMAVRATFDEEDFDARLLLDAAQDLAFKMSDLNSCLQGLDFSLPALTVEIPPPGPVSEEEKQKGKENASNLFNNSNDLFKKLQDGQAAASDIDSLLDSVEADLKKTQQAIIDQDPNATNRAFLQAVASAATVSAVADKVVDFVEKKDLDKAARAAEALEAEQATLKDKITKCSSAKHDSAADASLEELAKKATSLDASTQSLVEAVQDAASHPEDEKKTKAAIKASIAVRKVSDDLVDTAIAAKKQASPDAEHNEAITKATVSAAKSRAAVVAVRASFTEEDFDTKILLDAAQDLSLKMTDLAACLSSLDFSVPAVVPIEEKKPEPVPEPVVEVKQPEPEPAPAPTPAPVAEPVVEEKKPEPKPDSARDVVTPRGSKKNALDALIGRTLSRSLSGVKLSEDKPVEAVIDEVAKLLESNSGDDSEGKRIAETLRNLAAAARAGKKEDMQSSARTLASQLSDLVKKGREVHKLEPAGIARNVKMNYESLGKACDSLANYSTQIRIVVNVKVNSTGSSDGDEALSSLAKSIGLAVRDITSNMEKVQAAK
eukprot:TRINITY_DN4817_c0_g1_i1.p1 TRINITY_DN4817_c0_g1~~TRINITY_DN4817_c0_g1_i1.p1  ORF type:complete len:1383 (+),score=470.45 TRINITY_DN4817_c0_g1_i1:106-4254(+)